MRAFLILGTIFATFVANAEYARVSDHSKQYTKRPFT